MDLSNDTVVMNLIPVEKMQSSAGSAAVETSPSETDKIEAIGMSSDGGNSSAADVLAETAASDSYHVEMASLTDGNMSGETSIPLGTGWGQLDTAEEAVSEERVDDRSPISSAVVSEHDDDGVAAFFTALQLSGSVPELDEETSTDPQVNAVELGLLSSDSCTTLANSNNGLAVDDVPQDSQDAQDEPAVWDSDEHDGGDDDELPPYKAVALVKENEPNMQLTVQFASSGAVIQVGAADIDSIEQLKVRICRAAGDDARLDTSRVELTKPGMNTALEDGKSLLQLGFYDCSIVVVHSMPDSDATEVIDFVSPTGDLAAPLLPIEGDALQNQTQNNTGNVSTIGTKVDEEDSDSDDDSTPPPAYSMLDRTLNQARNRPPMTWQDKCLHVIMIIIATLITIGIFLAVPIALITFGAMRMDSCPAQNNIPIWMIVFGSVWLAQSLMDRLIAILHQKIETEIRQRPEYEVMPSSRIRVMVMQEYRKRYRRLDTLDQSTQLFGFVWFIIGSIWVFGCQDCKSDYDSGDDTGCDQTVYRWSLVVIVILYILLAVPFLAILLYMIGMTCCRESTSPA